MKHKNPIGRPTVITQDVILKLEEAFSFGCTDLEACFYAGISKTPFYNWLAENPDFKERKEALKQWPVMVARKSVMEGCARDYKLALEYLKHKKSDEFNTKQNLNVDGSLNVNVVKFCDQEDGA